MNTCLQTQIDTLTDRIGWLERGNCEWRAIAFELYETLQRYDTDQHVDRYYAQQAIAQIKILARSLDKQIEIN